MSTRRLRSIGSATFLGALVCASLLSLAIGGASCANEPRSNSGHGAVDGTVVVTGTVIDAATGAPVAEARLRGPRDTRATSDDKGRFELRGLQVGDAGELEATTEDRRAGRVPLRKLRPGPLEVVVFVTPVPRER